MSQAGSGREGAAIVLAAGRGERLGQDKGLLDLGGQTALARVVGDCAQAKIQQVIVVRRDGAAPVDLTTIHPNVRIVRVGTDEMIDSFRAGLAALDEGWRFVLSFPVDYALAGAGTVALLAAQFDEESAQKILLPIYHDHPGHPVAFSRDLQAEIEDASTNTLRDVVRRDPERVTAVTVQTPWVLRDLDTPVDVAVARSFLECGAQIPHEWMLAHRSHRSYHPDPLPPDQIERLVDAARYAPTASFIQAYSVVAVADAERRSEVASLCGEQQHIREAPVFLAICADLHKIQLACRAHGGEIQADTLELFLQSAVDAALLGQNLQLAAESEGLGSCMIGGARNRPVELAKLLGLPPKCFVLFGMVLGRPKDDPVPRGRMPLSAVLHEETYQVGKLAEDLEIADGFMRAWARSTNAKKGGYGGKPVNEERGWTDRMFWLWGRDRDFRAHLARELRQLGFGLDDARGP